MIKKKSIRSNWISEEWSQIWRTAAAVWVSNNSIINTEEKVLFLFFFFGYSMKYFNVLTDTEQYRALLLNNPKNFLNTKFFFSFFLSCRTIQSVYDKIIDMFGVATGISINNQAVGTLDAIQPAIMWCQHIGKLQ